MQGGEVLKPLKKENILKHGILCYIYFTKFKKDNKSLNTFEIVSILMQLLYIF